MEESNVITHVTPAQMTDEEIGKIRAKRRRKVFVKWLKRVVVGPILGFWLAIISFNIFHTSLVVSMIVLMAFTCVGLLVKFKYVKYAYLGLVASIYLLLISNVLSN